MRELDKEFRFYRSGGSYGAFLAVRGRSWFGDAIARRLFDQDVLLQRAIARELEDRLGLIPVESPGDRELPLRLRQADARLHELQRVRGWLRERVRAAARARESGDQLLASTLREFSALEQRIDALVAVAPRSASVARELRAKLGGADLRTRARNVWLWERARKLPTGDVVAQLRRHRAEVDDWIARLERGR